MEARLSPLSSPPFSAAAGGLPDAAISQHTLLMTGGDAVLSATLIANCRSALQSLQEEEAAATAAAGTATAAAAAAATTSPLDAMWLTHVGSEDQPQDMQVGARAGSLRSSSMHSSVGRSVGRSVQTIQIQHSLIRACASAPFAKIS